MDPNKRESFERAFRSGMCHCRVDCACGETYFDDVSGGYDWEDGELENLRESATAVDGSIGGIEFESRYYAECCECWHARAEKIMGFVDCHAHQIAEYLTLEKRRKERLADNSPTVG